MFELSVFAILSWIGLGLLGIILLVGLLGMFYSTGPQEMRIIKRLGKAIDVSRENSGLKVKAPFIDSVSEPISLAVQTHPVSERSKTKDDTFVTVTAAIQYKRNPDKLIDSYYRLSDPKVQIETHVGNAIRLRVPTLNLSEVFNDDGLKTHAKTELQETLSEYGWIITDVLISSVQPDDVVVRALNDKYASEQRKVTAKNEADADYLKVTRAAEARAKEMELHGQGLSSQRVEIGKGFAGSIEMLKRAGVPEEQASRQVALVQYMDTLKALADKGAVKVVFANSSPGGFAEIEQGIARALMVSHETADTHPAAAPAEGAEAPAAEAPQG